MKKPLVIISACQFTRLALESLIPADRYIVRVYSNVTTEVEFVLKTSCGYLLADIPSLPSGELVLLACLVRLRSDAGQWQVCLTGDSDWFDNAPASSLYNGFPHIGTLLKASRYQNQIIRWLLRPLPGDMSDFWLLTARELSVLKILMQGMSFSEIARYEQRSSKTLHAIATQALRKLGLGTLSDFRLLYTGCGDSRVKRNIRLHARYVGQHSAHRLTQYVQNMVSGILYPEKVIVGKSINSDAISGKVLSGQRKHMSKKDQECYDTAALLLPPTAARTDSLQCRGQNISTALGCRSGRHAVQPVQRAGVLTSVREGCVSFFSVPQELYLHSLKLYQPVLSAILPASEQKKSYAINCGTGRRVS
ncbi:LuxR family transcriptional regulator [Escherichia coli]|nr:LuxR family transcriptional regulator [Escherichia coli]EFH0987728.1 LuxR family transcriptional regulator [Escherichia coli]ELJ0555664.1 LuxR family transcriptional regulator [Escherichia coli]ELL6809260.1 LuxR family transcriptional regulator [Escherichia coli]MDN2273133.1 LuxR family transcriptional regulator [Escherichia coli]